MRQKTEIKIQQAREYPHADKDACSGKENVAPADVGNFEMRILMTRFALVPDCLGRSLDGALY